MQNDDESHTNVINDDAGDLFRSPKVACPARLERRQNAAGTHPIVVVSSRVVCAANCLQITDENVAETVARGLNESPRRHGHGQTMGSSLLNSRRIFYIHNIIRDALLVPRFSRFGRVLLLWTNARPRVLRHATGRVIVGGMLTVTITKNRPICTERVLTFYLRVFGAREPIVYAEMTRATHLEDTTFAAETRLWGCIGITE